MHFQISLHYIQIQMTFAVVVVTLKIPHADSGEGA